MKITIKVEEEFDFDGGNCEFIISKDKALFLEDFLKIYLDMLQACGFEYVDQLVAIKEDFTEISTDIF